MKSLSFLAFLTLCACGSGPAFGRVREVPIVRSTSADMPGWRVGTLLAEPPATIPELRRRGGDRALQVGWDVAVREPGGKAWTASCLASAYRHVVRTRGVAAYRNPTAVKCDLGSVGDEAFQLDLTRGGTDRDAGWLDDTSGVVTFDHAPAGVRPDRRPDRNLMNDEAHFVLRHDGKPVAWLQVRPEPRLWLVPALDAAKTQAVARAVLLALALESQAPAELQGPAQQPPAWAMVRQGTDVAVAPPLQD